MRPVDELVDEHEQARVEFFAERAAGREGHDVGDAEPLHRVDIGAVVDAGGREAVAAAVAGQEHHLRRADPPDPQGVRGLTPRRGDALLADLLQAGRS